MMRKISARAQILFLPILNNANTRWEHTEAWGRTSKLQISKHQQVQLLEAASILVRLPEAAEKGLEVGLRDEGVDMKEEENAALGEERTDMKDEETGDDIEDAEMGEIEEDEMREDDMFLVTDYK
jgi:hypothetical protein